MILLYAIQAQTCPRWEFCSPLGEKPLSQGSSLPLDSREVHFYRFSSRGSLQPGQCERARHSLNTQKTVYT